ncbi:MAG: exopolysaccharide biosynthesis protein [Bacilli bacterium]|nr:exopolysaccharide biosynthesis protein [Bacilli bacterium]
MILVTLGTQKQQFTRLLDYIENSNIKDEIIVQAGHTKYDSKKMKIFDFIDYDKMNAYIKKADLIITHGGTGSIISPLKMGKKVIACARKSKYLEHVDDHQEQIVDIFAEEGYILKLDEDISLSDLIKKSKNFKVKKFVSNTDNFIKKLEEEINN